MAADVQVREYNGSGPSATDKTSGFKFCAGDYANPGGSYPIVVDTSASPVTNYSYKKSLLLYANTAPAGGIDTVRVFTDGSISSSWTNLTLMGKTSGSYAQATGTEGTTGDQMVGGTDMDTYTSASPLAVTGSIGAATGAITSDYLELQVVVPTNGVQGSPADEDLTWRFNEF